MSRSSSFTPFLASIEALYVDVQFAIQARVFPGERLTQTDLIARGLRLSVGASIGVYGESPITTASILREADSSLVAAKGASNGCVIVRDDS